MLLGVPTTTAPRIARSKIDSAKEQMLNVSKNRTADDTRAQRRIPGTYVQFGCGLCAPTTWLNFDAGPAFWLEKNLPFLKPLLLRRGFPDYPANIRYGNVIEGLPVAPGTVDGVYCSHVLEHLALNEFRRAVRNVYSYLVPAGTFRFVLPDLEWLASSYLNSPDSEAASRFMRESDLGVHERSGGISGSMKLVFGRSAHLWMWDYKNMARELEAAGFTGIRRAQFHDNPDLRFLDVEDIGRWENCLGVECRKQG
jgi:SAM-dependent methyltransferase